jgi:HD-GYP domain-containing protein (c-di-GMP phosphodiesterase class II)
MLLEKVSEVFKKTCRADDVIARWGGDEFVVLLPKTTEEEANNVILRIKAEFDKVQIKAIKGSISMGAETTAIAGDDIMPILDRAEAKMYSVKTLERENVRSHAIKAIISALHENHPREKGHSERVSEMSVKMGKLLRLNDVDIHKLKFGGFLHDVGKIVLDPKLLDKNYALTELEMMEMKKHTTVGYRILNSFDDTVDLAEIALYHHERWDGQGYPKGVKGNAIPLLARIIAVAECYDRMLYPSRQLEPMTKEDAMKVIHDGAGTTFDPQMVKLFEKMMRSY